MEQQTEKHGVDRMQVRLEHLDRLLSLAGEVIINSATLQSVQKAAMDSATNNSPLESDGFEMLKIADESSRRISQNLHDLVMDIRLVDIQDTLRIFRRPMRDLSRQFNKQIDFGWNAPGVMIDKTLADTLINPLLHLLRNAVDHGIEPPQERKAAGKPESGSVTINVEDQEYSTVIVVKDDGRGIDIDLVTQAAQDKLGIRLKNNDLLEVLCVAGFSTSSTVTNTSGRGVGLDAVKTTMDRFDGKIQLETTAGKGSTFILSIPKLRAVNILDSITFRAGTMLLAVPVDKVVTLQSFPASAIHASREQEQFVSYRGEIIHLYNLAAILHGNGQRVPIDRDPRVIVVEGKREKMALTVDEFLGPQKLVNVPMNAKFHVPRGILGTSVFAGGKIGMNIDLATLEEMISPRESIEASMSNTALQEKHITPELESTPGEGIDQSSISDQWPAQVQDDELQIIIRELEEHINNVQDSFISLEESPDNSEFLNSAFRSLHALKGGFTMLAQNEQAAVAHQAETVLDYLRSGRLLMSADLMDTLLETVTCLDNTIHALPAQAPAPAAELKNKLHAAVMSVEQGDSETQSLSAQAAVRAASFTLDPTRQLQAMTAMRNGQNLWEAFITFRYSRQPDFLIVYLMLMRFARLGTVLASIPDVAEVEQARCENCFKVLLASDLEEAELDSVIRLELYPHFGIDEHSLAPSPIDLAPLESDSPLLR